MRKGCVSVIVPVYNQEHYIEACLNSIMQQSYSNLQIIVIDDGSTDSTGIILDELSKRDKRIEVYHTKNGGVSAARNYALNEVEGEYIQFVDADDTISKNMTKSLIYAIEQKNTDMAVCNYVKKFSKGYIHNNIMEKPCRYTSTEYLINTLKDPGHHYYGVVWNKLYKSDIIKNNNLSFDSKVTLGEDFIFNINYWRNSKNVTVLCRYLYIYNKTRNVTLSNVRYKGISDCINELENRKKIFEVYLRSLSEETDFEYIEQRIYQYWIVFYVRQKYSLKHEYTSWNQADMDKWHKMIDEDENIKKSLEIVSKKWIKRYMLNYELSFWIKKTIKKLLHI